MNENEWGEFSLNHEANSLKVASSDPSEAFPASSFPTKATEIRIHAREEGEIEGSSEPHHPDPNQAPYAPSREKESNLVIHWIMELIGLVESGAQ